MKPKLRDRLFYVSMGFELTAGCLLALSVFQLSVTAIKWIIDFIF